MKINRNWLLSKTFIHYGSNSFEERRFIEPILWPSDIRNKPLGGLWASVLYSRNGWYNWCKGQNFRMKTFKKSFRFKLKKNAKIYMINEYQDLTRLPSVRPLKEIKMEVINFVKVKEEWDGIFLTAAGVWRTRGMSGEQMCYNLYAWDCESLLILNKKVIQPT